MWKVIITHTPLPNETDDPYMSKLDFSFDENRDAFAQSQIDNENQRLTDEYNKSPVGIQRNRMYAITGRAMRNGAVFVDWSRTIEGVTVCYFDTEAKARHIEEVGREYYGLIFNAEESP